MRGSRKQTSQSDFHFRCSSGFSPELYILRTHVVPWNFMEWLLKIISLKSECVLQSEKSRPHPICYFVFQLVKPNYVRKRNKNIQIPCQIRRTITFIKHMFLISTISIFNITLLNPHHYTTKQILASCSRWWNWIQVK